MKCLLFLFVFLWAFEQAQGQKIVFTSDGFYVVSGIFARGMAIELFELDPINNKPLLVHRVGSLALWYDGLKEVGKASKNLQKAGKLAEDRSRI